MSAVGDVFAAIAPAPDPPSPLSPRPSPKYRAGQTGLLRLTWDNGDRTVLVNPALGGVTFGWNLHHTAADELFAAIEGSALHTRIIFDRMEQHGAPIHRVINGGGIPKRNAKLNQIYANVLRKPVLVPEGDVTSLGSVIFAFLAAGDFPTIEEAQDALCPPFKVFMPEPSAVEIYDRLYPLFRDAYFALGTPDATPDAPPAALGHILPELQSIRRDRYFSFEEFALSSQPPRQHIRKKRNRPIRPLILQRQVRRPIDRRRNHRPRIVPLRKIHMERRNRPLPIALRREVFGEALQRIVLVLVGMLLPVGIVIEETVGLRVVASLHRRKEDMDPVFHRQVHEEPPVTQQKSHDSDQRNRNHRDRRPDQKIALARLLYLIELRCTCNT
jgi:hypothetical protein